MAVVTKVRLRYDEIELDTSILHPQKVRFYLFALQMAQLPLIMVGRMKFFRLNPGPS